MTDSALDQDTFRIALGAYEGIKEASSSKENQDSAHREALSMVEKMFKGFIEAYEEYEEDSRNATERIKIGHLIRTDGGLASWYSTPKQTIGEWPSYRNRLKETGLPPEAIKAIDDSTNRILTHCANPKATGDRRKGLVIGYVQSGKTANYTGLIAKAVDAGYRIVVVLAGLYTNLRVQTQIRLQQDLGTAEVRENRGLAWIPLTSGSADIAGEVSPGFVSNPGNVAVMVVKKHERRLANVAKFLQDIPDETLRSRGVLVIDDESDQATPNTQAAKDLVSTINKRVKSIWEAVPTGSYVAYTATPFANVFIDPADAGDLYPDDFAMVLPKPGGYMGSDDFFDVHQTADEADDEAIHQLAHEVDDAEASVLAPKGRDLSSFAPTTTDSLEKAIRWFILATAVREIRTGARKHSSMLVHTSQRIHVHSRTKDVIADFIKDVALSVFEQEARFRSVFEDEIDRAATLRHGEIRPDWATVWEKTQEVLARVTVKIDNGASDDRLVYSESEIETVIAVGGGTLSRGLTLEGLVVSYFLRSSNAYDTLLQMGRWFGFRPKYRDLVRVWMGPGLLDDYAHLARVENELRDEVALMAQENKTPRDFAVKVRSHPGRLEITSPGKMGSAVLVRAGLGGTRRQTIYLDRSSRGISTAQEAARSLVKDALAKNSSKLLRQSKGKSSHSSVLLKGLANSDIVDFLRSYWVSPAERWLQPDAMEDWLLRHGHNTSWNLVLVSGPGGGTDGFSYADDVTVGLSSRPPMASKYWTPDRLGSDLPVGSDVVNIRALMSGDDYILDLKILADEGLLSDDQSAEIAQIPRDDFNLMKSARSRISPDEGVVLLYTIDRDSLPKKDSKTRTSMDADGNLIGLGVVFPNAEAEDPGEYWAVPIEEPTTDEELEELSHQDSEDDYVATETP
ncbi:Z1 domain-containing protein [Brevibacterium sp. UCMA 11752]|uniref:Z1 domain-containing protein n=1 Tax=Brevibacterium sp. UCMA 11752 TaxID=2745946 RepID=UPI001F254405|nr:Z1 domain-containing protein [Brevibacterium sp. UCMA 11752]MCF2586103.1 Z1 domain-containing protein [Brevibacterium sp. UCMA 11752]